MEWLQTLLDSSTAPALTAFLLGLLTAISPSLHEKAKKCGAEKLYIEDLRKEFVEDFIWPTLKIGRAHV